MEIYLGSPDFTLIVLRKNYSSQFMENIYLMGEWKLYFFSFRE